MSLGHQTRRSIGLGLTIALIVVVIVAGCFALGYLVGPLL